MTDGKTLSIRIDLPMPAKPPVQSFEVILATSGETAMGVSRYPWRVDAPLDQRIERAEQLLAACSVQAGALREAMAPMPGEDIANRLFGFVSAWPNASGGDLAGYGAQLIRDVAERTPCRYAVEHALRHLRQTSRFLPSIAEVLAALDDAQTRIRTLAYHISVLPNDLVRAREELASERARTAMIAEREAAALARRRAEGKSENWD